MMTFLTMRPIAALTLTGLLAAGSPAAAAAARPARPAAQQRVLATTTLTQFKVTLVATRDPGSGPAPAATITARGYRHTPAGWTLIAAKTIGQPGQWYWYPAQACSLRATQLTTTPSGTITSDAITVSLLITPALGCSQPYPEHWTP